MTTFGDERSTLLRYLHQYRATLERKCADLNADQLARRSVPPSTLSLLGLVRYLAEVERSWFHRLSGEDAAGIWWSDEHVQLRDVLVHLVEEYARHCGHADLLRESVDGRTGD